MLASSAFGVFGSFVALLVAMSFLLSMDCKVRFRYTLPPHLGISAAREEAGHAHSALTELPRLPPGSRPSSVPSPSGTPAHRPPGDHACAPRSQRRSLARRITPQPAQIFFRDGLRRFASGSRDGTVRLWRPAG